MARFLRVPRAWQSTIGAVSLGVPRSVCSRLQLNRLIAWPAVMDEPMARWLGLLQRLADPEFNPSQPYSQALQAAAEDVLAISDTLWEQAAGGR